MLPFLSVHGYEFHVAMHRSLPCANSLYTLFKTHIPKDWTDRQTRLSRISLTFIFDSLFPGGGCRKKYCSKCFIQSWLGFHLKRKRKRLHLHRLGVLKRSESGTTRLLTRERCRPQQSAHCPNHPPVAEQGRGLTSICGTYVCIMHQ